MEKRFGPVVFLPGNNGGMYPHCHSLYIEADTRVVVDPACDRERLAEILRVSGVDTVLLSHWHEDHFRYLDLFDGKELWMSRLDAPPLASLDKFFDAYGLNEEERGPWTRTMHEVFGFKPRNADRLILDGTVMDLGGLTMEVVHTPGHTPGHLSLYFPEQRILFLGDYDLTPFGPWYGDVYSSIEETIASVNRLRNIPARVWITCHGSGLFESDPGHLWESYLRVIDDRDARLLDLLKEPKTMPEIVDACIVYKKKREPTEFFDFGERAIMGKHLERLMKLGMVTCEDATYCKT